MHGPKYERKLDELLSELGILIVKNKKEDHHEAIDSRAVGISPHGDRCLCEPQPCNIVLQYTLQDDAIRKLKEFTHLARQRGGKNLYVVLTSSEWKERLWLWLIAKQIREAVWHLYASEDPNIVKVLRINIIKEKFWCRLCNKATRDCDCLYDLKKRGYTTSYIEKGLSENTTQTGDYSYAAELLDPEEVIHDLRVILNSHKTRTRIGGALKNASPSGGQIRILYNNDTKEIVRFRREDVRDFDLRQLITNWANAKKDESLRAPIDRLLKVLDKRDLLDGLEINFEVEETGEDLRGARWILPANEEQLSFLRKIVRLLRRDPAALNEAIESAGQKAARAKKAKPETPARLGEEVLANI